MLDYQPLHPEYERPFTDEVIQEALKDRASVRIDMMCEQGEDYFRVAKELMLREVIQERRQSVAPTSLTATIGRFVRRIL